MRVVKDRAAMLRYGCSLVRLKGPASKLAWFTMRSSRGMQSASHTAWAAVSNTALDPPATAIPLERRPWTCFGLCSAVVSYLTSTLVRESGDVLRLPACNHKHVSADSASMGQHLAGGGKTKEQCIVQRASWRCPAFLPLFLQCT